MSDAAASASLSASQHDPVVDWLRNNATFSPSSKGQAADTIRGFVYQSERAVWVWINLKSGQLLQVEMQEDYDIQELSEVRELRRESSC